MNAAGRVATGFSKPYIADYTNSSGSVVYSNPIVLARGVSVNVSPESSDDNKFYADNVVAEDAGGVFTGGNVTLGLDGLHPQAWRRALGRPEPDADGWTPLGDSAEPPYLGIGYIVRYMSGGVKIYVPNIITKAKFKIPEESAQTQEDEINWQSMEMEAALFRDDTVNHNWRFVGADFETEEDAEAALVEKLGGSGA